MHHATAPPGPPHPGQPSADTVTRLEPTSERGRRTRTALVVAARTVFENLGYADANVAAITQVARVGYGSFYVYFSSKEEIFSEVAATFIDGIYQQSRAAADVVGPLARVSSENRRFFELYRDNARMFQLIEEQAAVDARFRDLLASLRSQYVRRAARGLRRLQSRGEIDQGLDADFAAEALSAMVERTAHLSVLHDMDGERMQETLDQLWRNAVRYQPRG